MDLSRLLRSVALVAISLIVLTSLSSAVSHRNSLSTSPDREEPITSCSQLNIQFDNRHAVVQSEERTISKAEAPTLRIQTESNGGLQVEGWDKEDYSVTLCKAADPAGNAQEVLSKIRLTFQNGELGVSGPSSQDRWSAHMLVKTPKGASLEVRVNNGPLALFRVDGAVRVRAENGPITVIGGSGDLDVTAKNGPVTFDGNSGKLRIDAQNGPVTVSLKGTTWSGSGIEAHANNGPLTLQIPQGYQSGVLVESDGHSPFQCRASVCSEGRKTWDDNLKSIQFGSGPTMIHLSTNNGPVSVN